MQHRVNVKLKKKKEQSIKNPVIFHFYSDTVDSGRVLDLSSLPQRDL